MAPGGMVWDAAADRELLLTILKTQNITIDYAAVAGSMTTDTRKCTVDAIKHRMKKLKAMAKDGGGDEDEGTPKPKGKRARASNNDGETPAKKTKTTKSKAKGKKADADDDQDGEGDGTNGIKEEAAEDEEELA